MPESITTIIDWSQYTTAQIADIMKEAGNELKNRIIPTSYPVEEVRGGIRPTSQPLNP